MNLRNKYQEKLQRAIAQNDFSNAKYFIESVLENQWNWEIKNGN